MGWGFEKVEVQLSIAWLGACMELQCTRVREYVASSAGHEYGRKGQEVKEIVDAGGPVDICCAGGVSRML